MSRLPEVERAARERVVRPLFVDPGGTVLRRSVRVAVLGTSAFVVLGRILHLDAVAAAALFAIIALDGFTDFWGPPLRRFGRYVGAGLAGACMFPLVAVVRPSVPLLLVTTAAVTFGVYFLGVLGGPYFAARFPVMIAFLYAATALPEGAASVDDVVGWLLGTVAAAVASAAFWPAHRRYPIRSLLSDLAAASAAVLRTDDPADREHLRDAADELRSVSVSRRLRTGAVAVPDRILAECVHQAERLVAVIAVLATDRSVAAPEDLVLLAETAATLDAVAGAIDGSRRSVTRRPPIPCGRLRRAVVDHVAAGERRLAPLAATADDVELVARSTEFRLVAVAALELADLAEAWRAGGRTPTGPVAEPFVESGPVDSLRRHARVDSLWFRNSIRAAVACTVAVGLVQAGVGSGRGFWIALGTISVLRADLATVSRSATTAVVGTAVGFVVSTGVLAVAGDVEPVLWMVLPVVLFLSAAENGVHPVVGTAAFTTFVVTTVAITSPELESAGQLRLVNATIGAVVAFGVAALLWPRIGTVPEGAVAEVLGRLARSLRDRTADPAAPGGPSPVTCVTDLDRVVDMVATSSPRSIPVEVRFRLGVIVQLGAVTSSVVSGRSDEVGAAPLEVPVEDWGDPEARSALLADVGRSAASLDDLADRVAERGAPPPPEVTASSLLELACRRVGREVPGAPLVDLVRLGGGLRRLADVAAATAGVRHGQAVTRVG